MKLELTQKEKDELLPHIKAVLETGKSWEDEQLHHPAGAIIDAILEIKGVKKGTSGPAGEGFDQNGWQFDWWQTFKYKGKFYTLSGSGFHGGHEFHLADEQDEEVPE